MRSALISSAILAVLTLGACTTSPQSSNAHFGILEPKVGEGLIYLLRTPQDSLKVEIRLAGDSPIKLPAQTHVVLQRPAGSYSIETWVKPLVGEARVVAPTLVWNATSGQRSFFRLDGKVEIQNLGPSGIGISMAMGNHGAAAMTPPMITVQPDSRHWVAITQDEALSLLVNLPETRVGQ